MFTLPDKLPHDDQLPVLEYVFHLATLIEPFEDFCGSPLLERYISRYNTSATKSRLKKLDKLKARLNEFLSHEEFGETLTSFELDTEKFWHLLLFVYDFSYNQCTDGIKQNNGKHRTSPVAISHFQRRNKDYILHRKEEIYH